MMGQVSSRGSWLGSALLVFGCCIGAGMLGMPVLSAQAGFIPSVVLFLVTWLYMLSTGLLLLEVNLWFTDSVSLISLAERTVGWGGKFLAWGGFFFLFYALMVAYIDGSALIALQWLSLLGIYLPHWFTALLFPLFFGCLIALGTGAVDRCNRGLMVGLMLSYLLLVFFGGSAIRYERLWRSDWSATYQAIPIMIIAFGYHNLIPSLTDYLARDRVRLFSAILFGSLSAFFIYLIWQGLILGLIPSREVAEYRQVIDEGEIATQLLYASTGNSAIFFFAEIFAFFSIITSFLAVALSFVDFLIDGWKLSSKGSFRWAGKMVAAVAALFPPYLCSLFYPRAFLLALGYGGAFGAVILYGILPIVMVWQGRYRQGRVGPRLLPGGRPMLLLLLSGSLVVMSFQFF